MPFSGDPFLIWPHQPDDREIDAGPMAAIYFPVLLKQAFPADGRIHMPRGKDPLRHVFHVLGGRSRSTDQFLRRALPRLVEVGLLKVERDAVVVPDIKRFDPKAKRPQIYSQLWANEVGSFRRLSPEARGLAAHLQRICDQQGGFGCEPAEVVRMLHWQDERNLLRRGWIASWLAELWRDGFIVPHPEGIEGMALIRNFAALQPRRKSIAERGKKRLEERGDLSPNLPKAVAPERHPSGIPAAPERHHQATGAAPEWHQTGGKPLESLRRAADHRQIRQTDQTPQSPQAAEGGGVLENSKAEEQSHEAPDLPPDRPAWYRSIFAGYPNPEGELAAWTEAKRAAALAGSGEQLAAMTLERLPWQKRQTRWRKQGGQFVPSLANYFARGHWRDPKPADPNAFADPPETPAEKKARQDAARAKRIAEQIAASKPTSPSSRTDAIRGSWLARPESAAYSAPANPEALAIASAVLHERLEAFRAENPTAELPALLAGFVAAQEQARGPHGPSARFAEQGPAPPVAAASPAEANRFGKPRGQAAPEPIAADEPIDPAALTKLRRIFARRCDRLDEEIKALEIRTGAIP